MCIFLSKDFGFIGLTVLSLHILQAIPTTVVVQKGFLATVYLQIQQNSMPVKLDRHFWEYPPL